MPLSIENIDRAIVMTQYDLRGFAHPLGFREEKMNPKSLDAITANFVGSVFGISKDESTDKSYVDYFTGSFEEKLAMCRHFAEGCGCSSQKEATQLIIQEIVRQSEQMKAEVVSGDRKESAYLKSLSKDNCWGGLILALAEVFEVPLEEEVVA